jgi:hypothetical protein
MPIGTPSARGDRAVTACYEIRTGSRSDRRRVIDFVRPLTIDGIPIDVDFNQACMRRREGDAMIVTVAPDKD